MSTNYSLQNYWASERGIARKKELSQNKGRPITRTAVKIKDVETKPTQSYKHEAEKDPSILFDTWFWYVKKTDDPKVLMVSLKEPSGYYWDLRRSTLEETSYIFKRLFTIYSRYTIEVILDLSKVCYTIHLR